jgi:multidrug efflux system membrane fusion protein
MRAWYAKLNRPTRLAVWIMGGICLWMATGLFSSGREGEKDNTSLRDKREISARIGIRLSRAEPHQRSIALNGVTEPNRVVGLKAQTAGPILNFPIKEGNQVKKGEVLVEIDPQNRPEQLRRAQALVEQREIEYKASQRLAKKGFTTEVRYAESKTQMEDARRELKQAQIDLSNTKIRAPFDGVLERLNAEVGDFVGVGVFGGESAIAQVVDPDPLIIASSIPQTDLPKIQREGDVEVRIPGMELMHGRIRYVASVADNASRSFRVEVELPNEGYKTAAGLTAEIRLPLETVQAHRLSSSLLGLDDAGGVGVKTVDENGLVHFRTITILDEDESGLWVAGLPEQAWIITQGQAFVNDGQRLNLKKVKREGQEAARTTAKDKPTGEE